MNALHKAYLSIVLLAALCCPHLGYASPAPTLKVDLDANWETAWEVAWATAWEACGQVAAAAVPSPVEDALLRSAVTISLDADQSGIGLNFVWGFDSFFGRPSARGDRFFSFGLTAADLDPRAMRGGFAATPGKLFVQADPADAEIVVLNAGHPFAQGIDLDSGEYVLSIKREGYAAQTRRVEIIPGMAATVRITLAKGQERMAPAGADSGQSSDRQESAAWDAQFNQLSLTPSMPVLRTKQAASANARLKTFATSPADARDAQAAFSQGALAAGRAAATGMLFVDSEPAGADIRVMNIKPKFKQGMELASGKYRVEARITGYKTVEREVFIATGGTNRVSFTMEQALTGRLFVETEPAGATVRVKNIRPKFTQGMELNEGKYVLEILAAGCKPLLREVAVAPQVDNRVLVSMDAIPSGRLFVETEPANALITVRNSKETFVQGMELPVGKYAIEVASAEFKPKTTEIDVVAGADNRVQLSLEPARADKKQPNIGRLYVHVDPEAVVKILRIKPKFSQGIELAAGRYTVHATRKGFKDTKKQVDIVAGRDTFIALNLLTKNGAQPRQARFAVQPAVTSAVTSVVESVAPVVSVIPAAAPASATAVSSKNERTKFDVEAFVSMAIVAVNAGDFASAMEATKQALKLDPNAADAYKTMGDAYLLQEAFPEAVSCYDKALAINPEDTRLRQNKNYAAEQVQLKGNDLRPTHGQAVIRDQGLSYKLDGPSLR